MTLMRSGTFLTPLSAVPGNGPLAGSTTVFAFNLVNFDWTTWHNYEWENWAQVDALLNSAIGFAGFRGIWRAQTAYIVGEKVYDPTDTTKAYTAQSSHTSSTSWATDKPLYWALTTALGPPVTSVFGRIGAVVPLAGDYAAFYMPLAGGTFTGNVVLASSAPSLYMSETDQVDPAGRWRLTANGNVLYWEHAITAGTFTGAERAMQLNGALKRLEVDLPWLMRVGRTVLGIDGNHLRMKENSTATTGIAALMRTDTTYHYLCMLTDDGDADGSFNALRPLYVRKDSGQLRSANGQWFLGGMQVDDSLMVTADEVVLQNDHTTGLRIRNAAGAERAYLYANATAPYDVSLRNRTWGGGATVSYITLGGDGRAIISGDAGIYLVTPLINGLSISNASGGISFGSTIVASATDLSKHILLHSNNYGWSITNNRLNHVVGSTGTQHDFYIGSTLVATVNVNGTASPQTQTIITREKGDLRYASASSQRYKTQIADADASGLAQAFDMLALRQWVWGGELDAHDERAGTIGYGFIAEELAPVAPAAVRYQWIDPGVDPQGMPLAETEKRPNALNVDAICAVLVAKIRALEERLLALETPA